MGNNTVINTPYRREITVTDDLSGTYLTVKNTVGSGYPEIKSFLSEDNAKELGIVLLEAAGTGHTVVTDLPEVIEDPFDGNYLRCGGVSRHIAADPAETLKLAKELFAVAKELQKRADDKAAAEAAEAAVKAEAEKAAAAKLDKRRDELAEELSGDSFRHYSECSYIFKKSIDRIIELEGKVQPVKFPAF